MEDSTVHRPKLIMIRGIPGSGKSYIASSLAQRIGKDNVLLLDPDEVDLTNPDYLEFSKSLSNQGLDRSIHPFRWLRKHACEGVEQGRVVIWSQPFTNKGIFDRLIKYIQDSVIDKGINLPVHVVEVEIDLETAKQRVDKRRLAGGHSSVDVVIKRYNEYNSYADYYDTTIVSGKGDVNDSVNEILGNI